MYIYKSLTKHNTFGRKVQNYYAWLSNVHLFAFTSIYSCTHVKKHLYIIFSPIGEDEEIT